MSFTELESRMPCKYLILMLITSRAIVGRRRWRGFAVVRVFLATSASLSPAELRRRGDRARWAVF